MEEIDIDIIKEFVIESSENLARLDREMVELEQSPNDANLLASIFRTIHTIKGTCGFLSFHILERITHHAESILSQLRNGERKLTAELVSLILATVDAVKSELTSIETTYAESGVDHSGLLKRLEAAANGIETEASQPEIVQAAEDIRKTENVEAASTQGSVSVADSTIPGGCRVTRPSYELSG